MRIGRVSKGEVEAFTRQLANLLAAGVPLSRALSILSREASRPAAARLWATVHDQVAGGASLADAFAQHPKVFSPVYVAMVRAGETGGFLDVVLEQIATFRSREQDLKGKVTSALIYPMILSVLASGILAFLLIYFIPRFSLMFAEFGGSLPALTKGDRGGQRAGRPLLVRPGACRRSDRLRDSAGVGARGRTSHPGASDAPIAVVWPGGGEIRPRAVLPDAGHAHRGRRAARGGPARGQGSHRQPGPGGHGGRRDRGRPARDCLGPQPGELSACCFRLR